MCVWTYDGGHGVLGSGGDENAQVWFAVVHVHVWRRFGLHAFRHVPRRDQQTGGTAVVSVSIPCKTTQKQVLSCSHSINSIFAGSIIRNCMFNSVMIFIDMQNNA